mmetsp:Transcript_73337/g.185770  ORF Transcript_73337/g.185770 Transcript_73337/m.185770 type:complete len:218 (-) Transcript_73337:495-1148(-)
MLHGLAHAALVERPFAAGRHGRQRRGGAVDLAALEEAWVRPHEARAEGRVGGAAQRREVVRGHRRDGDIQLPLHQWSGLHELRAVVQPALVERRARGARDSQLKRSWFGIPQNAHRRGGDSAGTCRSANRGRRPAGRRWQRLCTRGAALGAVEGVESAVQEGHQPQALHATWHSGLRCITVAVHVQEGDAEQALGEGRSAEAHLRGRLRAAPPGLVA